MSTNDTESHDITSRQNEEEHKLVPEPNLDNVMLSEGDTIHAEAKVLSYDSGSTDADIFLTKTLSERLKYDGASDTMSVEEPTVLSAAEQTVVSIADSSSSFGDRMSASRASSEDCGDDGHLNNEEDETKTDMEKSERIHMKQKRYFGGFMFGRKRHSNPKLPEETVTILHYPFPPTSIPVGDDENDFRKSLADAKSQHDVLQTIANTQPDMVMVELCPSRISILSMDEDTLLEEAKNLNFDKIINTIKQSGAIQGILHVLLLSMSAHMTKTLGMAPGGEFRAAHKGAMNVKMCKLILGDRPIHVTVQRALGSLSFFKNFDFFTILFFPTKPLSRKLSRRSGKVQKSDMLEELLKQMAGEFPLLSKIFVEERDLYMTNALHTLLKKSTFDKRVAWSKTNATWQPISVVAVVGMGHVPGIISNWNKRIDVGDLLIIPQATHTEKFMRLTLKAMIIGVVGYVFYQAHNEQVDEFVDYQMRCLVILMKNCFEVLTTVKRPSEVVCCEGGLGADMDELKRIAFVAPFRYEEGVRYISTLRNFGLYFSALYVITIFSIKFVMTRFKPFQLTAALNFWNTWLAVFSVLGSFFTSIALFSEISNRGFVASYTKIGDFFEGTSGYWTWLFCLSKFAELGDTILIVLRKKPLIFLHWYHHVLTLNYGIISYSQHTPYNTWIIWLNFTVHSFMYSYYFLRSINIRVPAAIARNITSLQLLQFIITLLILMHVGYLMAIGEAVDGTLSTYLFCLGMEISYVILLLISTISHT
ncbi:Elongation of very long chain fatty acids protein [Dirofilaria immitis]|nr:Elongation of very long chain fatty acids protein [Dirofilaria immitis]